MSIVIGITGEAVDSEFYTERYGCECVKWNGSTGKVQPDCNDCHGTGTMKVVKNKFELNWSLSSLYVAFRAIGIRIREFGTVDAVELYCAIDDFEKSDRDTIAFGKDYNLKHLKQLAEEAVDRNERVVWG